MGEGVIATESRMREIRTSGLTSRGVETRSMEDLGTHSTTERVVLETILLRAGARYPLTLQKMLRRPSLAIATEIVPGRAGSSSGGSSPANPQRPGLDKRAGHRTQRSRPSPLGADSPVSTGCESLKRRTDALSPARSDGCSAVRVCVPRVPLRLPGKFSG